MKSAAVPLGCGLASGLAHAHDAALVPASAWGAWSSEAWLWALLVLTGALALHGVRNLWRHARAGAGVRRWQVVAFGAGWLVLTLAMMSPLDALGGQLFWAHMVQHELMMVVAAPLLVLSRPLAIMVWGLPPRARPLAAAIAARLRLKSALHLLSQPLTAWLVHAGVLWVWHAPTLFQTALSTRWVHDLQHASFFISALLFWWSALPASAARLAVAVLCVFTTAVHTSILGALLTFSGRVLYPAYEGSVGAWGLTALEDQQLGGLIMWVPGGAAYLAAALGLIAARLGRSRSRAWVAPG